MYHTFQAAKADAGDAESAKSGRQSASRRISTSNACVECRRRKIRCDGESPCGHFQWYQHPQLCTYAKPIQRIVPSRKLVDQLQTSIDQHHAVLSRLFPGQDVESLISLPREELINLAVTLPAPTTSPPNNAAGPGTTISSRESDLHHSEGAESLKALEQAPDHDPEIDEAKRHRDKVQAISDDVNGLSLSVDRQSSYVGVSSISAALKVIFKTVPLARTFIAQSYAETTLPSRSNTPPPQARPTNPHYLPPADIGHKLIESYFAHVHVLMPMIDEDQFWHTYLYGERRDPPWLALLNMVMALGSLSLSTCDNEEHIGYFQRARQHMDLETYGSGNLLNLQALGLLSGYYLHWLNRPNEANCLMGATLRMATSLGLHREYGDGNQAAPPAETRQEGKGFEVPIEIRRRTWWSLFCLDAWGSTTTGRPSLGRTGPGVTVQSPKIPEQMNNAQYLASLRLLPIIHNIEFCKIATRIQDTLAARSICKFDELFALDAELVKWHEDLPPILRDVIQRPALKQRSSSGHGVSRPGMGSPSGGSIPRRTPFDFSQPPSNDRTACPEVLKTPRAIMHWRYQNLRMLMHRPYLLATALRHATYSSMTAEEKVAVGRCRIIAGQTIVDINSTCQEELIAGWNAVWLMYQAVMVPLVSLFSHLSYPRTHIADASPGQNQEVNEPSTSSTNTNDAEANRWRKQIETAIAFFDKMRRYSVAAKKSKDVVERLYEASKYISHSHEQQTQIQQQQLWLQQNTSPGQNFDSQVFGPDTIVTTGPEVSFPYGDQEMEQNQPFGLPTRELSPNGAAAMNNFWNDMMWETFPEMPDAEATGWVPGLEQLDRFDWIMPNEQQGDQNTGGQQWSQWSVGEEEEET